MPRQTTLVRRKKSKPSRDLVNEIPDLVSSVLLNHLKSVSLTADRRHAIGMQEVSVQYPHEQFERAECLAQQDWFITPRMSKVLQQTDIEYSEETGDLFDPSLAALDEIVSNAHRPHDDRASRRSATSRMYPVRLPFVHMLPKYDAWIPVRTNYWAGKQLHIEPYMPFLGDQDHDCELAFEVFEDMADDAGQELDLSDGEVGTNGKLVLPRDDVERCEYYSIAQSRWREGSRKAILAVLDKFVQCHDAMWRVLAASLGMKDIRRIKAIAKVAQDRRHERRATSLRRKKEKEMTQAVREARSCPGEEEMPLEEEWSAHTNPLRMFCFTCHVFPCPQHAGVDVQPIHPIEDPAARERDLFVRSGNTKPCSKYCFLHPDKGSHSTVEWSAQDILLLREAVPIFGFDPCRLAIIIGSRTCREVCEKLDDPIEADILQYEIQKARRVQRIEGSKRRQVMQDEDNDNAKISAKSVVDTTDPTAATDQDFVPCYHNGPCTAESCMCVKKGMYCEATCGCNSGRYVQAGKSNGIVWVETAEASRQCRNRHRGCSCETGFCESISCACWDQNRACNPDLCGCDCSVLPGHTSVHKRRCRNIPATIAKHKKTYVGRSNVHGYGLFAGESFEAGELVGVYSGQLIDTRLADMIGRLYDATDRTYIFNVTESLVIDGGLLGSKAKFVNHTKPGIRENCASKLIRVRGDAFVALFTKRKVEAGEEFLFDYRFTGEVPGWAVDDGGKNSKRK